MPRSTQRAHCGTAVVGLLVTTVLALAATSATLNRLKASQPAPFAAEPAGRLAFESDDTAANASRGLDVKSSDGATVVAAFSRRSYRPGAIAVLRLWRRYPVIRIEVIRVGTER